MRSDNGDIVGEDGVVTDGQVVDDGDSGDIIGDSGDVGEDVSVADFLPSRGREPFVLMRFCCGGVVVDGAAVPGDVFPELSD